MSARRADHGVAYWDRLATGFDEHVCHVLAEDRQRVVDRALRDEARRLGARKGGRAPVRIGDFGCGTGRALPLLLRHFERVLAVDGSARCLEVARETAPDAGRVEFVEADLAAERLRLPRVEAGLCINVALTPDETARARMLRNVARCVRPPGRLLLVVPALESELLVRRRWRRWSGKPWPAQEGEDLVKGLVLVGGARTKLWMREELLLLARQLRCRVASIERVEYGWESELVDPPRSMRAPYPWDWLGVLERV